MNRKFFLAIIHLTDQRWRADKVRPDLRLSGCATV